MKNYLLLVFFASFIPVSLHAQDSTAPSSLHGKLAGANNDLQQKTRNFNIDFLLRSSLNFSDTDPNHLQLDESRFMLRGNISEHTSFQFRYRMNRSHAHDDLDNSPGSLDHAFLLHKFGKDRKWSLTAGKQAAEVGSWEFENNPTYEYHFTEYVGNILNLFLVGFKLGYEVVPDQIFSLQIHNTYNKRFASILNTSGYNLDGLAASSNPLGLYASWRGGFADNKFRTFYSFNVSEYAKGEVNTSVALGNKLTLPRFHAYLDVQTTNQAVDFANIASPVFNAVEVYQGADRRYARNVNYQTAVLRLDYEFIPKWYMTAKGWYESASMKDNDKLGSNFRNRIGYWAGLEFKPMNDQDLRFFANYFSTHTHFASRLRATSVDTSTHTFAVGFLYVINAL